LTVIRVFEVAKTYTIEASVLPLKIYITAALEAGNWVKVNDFEFSVDERFRK